MGTTSSASFGLPGIESIESRLLLSTTLISEGDIASYWVPTDSSVDAVWRDTGFDDSAWDTGPTGLGYERSSGYEELIATDLESLMYGNNETVYIRMPFDLGWAGGVTALTLRMKFEDGFAAYLNGHEVASHNAPATRVWNSSATNYHGDSYAVIWQDFDASAGVEHLVSGTNVLAIHGMNLSTTSSDVLVLPELVAEMDDTHFGVDSTDPADGAFLNEVPSSITLEFSESVQRASVQASDLQIDGQASTSFTQLGATTVRFDLPAGLGSGLHTFTLAEGALTSESALPLAAYTGEFRAVTAPVVTGVAATEVTHAFAVANWEVTDTGDDDPVITLYWGEEDGDTTPGSWDKAFEIGLQGVGSGSVSLEDLQASTPYYYRVFATNWAGQSWSPATKTFTTLPPQTAMVSVDAATNILPTSARLNGQIADTGGEDPHVFMVWGDDNAGAGGTWDHAADLGVLGRETFYVDATDLEAETTYYFAAFAVSSAGMSWAPAVRSFETSGDGPLITELMAVNDGTIQDEDGEYSDWIEIHNPGDAVLDLDGWYLTDETSNLDEWQFPSVTVPAGGYLLVFASGKDRAAAGSELHTSFRLSGSGEYVGLVQPDGDTVAHGMEFPEQYGDISYGLTPDLTSLRFLATPTPGSANVAEYWARVDEVSFSVSHGFYDEAFDLYLSCATDGAQVRYTLDGSKPTATHGTIYSSGTPIPITTTTAVRASAFKMDHEGAAITSATYLFLDDVIHQPEDQSARGMPSMWGAYDADYEMDLDIVDSAAYSGRMRGALMGIPTLSIVMDSDELFSTSTGFYTNSMQHGEAWEREISLEYFDPNGDMQGFQVNCGIRAHGELARHPDVNPKRPMRLLFKGDYGPTKLTYPIFGEESDVSQWDTIVLRANYGNSWITNREDADYIRNPFSHAMLRGTGQVGPESTLAHVYLNGVYWGVYNPEERPDDSFSAEHFSGEKEEWDVIKGLIVGQYWELHSGQSDAWQSMWSKIPYLSGPADLAHTLSDTDYATILQYVDMDNFIDYMITHMYINSYDWPQKNWYTTCRRDPDNPAGPPIEKFRWYTWDMENNSNWHEQDRTTVGDTDYDNKGPGRIHKAVRLREDYQRLFGDHVQALFFNDGPWEPAKNRARYEQFSDMLDMAIIGESARWGDWRNPSTPFTRDDHWAVRTDYMLNSFTALRNSFMLDDFRNIGLYPSIDAPVYSQHGGEVASGYELQVTGTGTIYYTLDGSDPMDSSQSMASGDRITLSGIEEVTVKTRAYSGGEWSALNAATFVVGASTDTPNALRISELMYNPGLMAEADDLEYIELVNTGAEALLVGGASLVDGVELTFPSGTIIPAGGRVLAVGFDPQSEPAKVTAFETHYGLTPGSVMLVGPYTGVLSDGGEDLALSDVGGDSILAFEYGDAGAWPGRADGKGASLEVIDPFGDYTDPENWRSSTEYLGNPGSAGMGPLTDIVINEVLSHTDLPDVDSIELYNTTDGTIDIGGWYLSDSSDEYRKYRIPDGTTIDAHEYVVFDEWDFNASMGVDPEDFALNGAHGDDVWLMAADGTDRLTRFVDHVEFGGSKVGESFGRWPNETGDLYPMTSQSLGDENPGPRVGPLVLSEIMYNSGEALGADDLEYVEVYNPTGGTVDLTAWRIRKGIDFDFPEGTQILPGQAIVVASFDPSNSSLLASFRSAYGIDESVVVLGPYDGKLENGGERVQLQRPDSPPLEEPEYVPHTLEDEVVYDEESPWPGADGDGNSLHRVDAAQWGNDPLNWASSSPTPGTVSGSSVPGDANGDGAVTDADYTVWADHYGTSSGATPSTGDFTGDGAVTDADYTVWADHHGLGVTQAASTVEESQPVAVSETQPEADPEDTSVRQGMQRRSRSRRGVQASEKADETQNVAEQAGPRRRAQRPVVADSTMGPAPARATWLLGDSRIPLREIAGSSAGWRRTYTLPDRGWRHLGDEGEVDLLSVLSAVL